MRDFLYWIIKLMTPRSCTCIDKWPIVVHGKATKCSLRIAEPRVTSAELGRIDSEPGR